MKKTVFILLLLSAAFTAFSQSRGEYGVFLGTSYYMGELNPSKHFVDVAHPSAGLVYRQHLNSRYALKFSGIYGKLSGSDDLFDIGFNGFRNLSFKSDLIEFSGQLEFNFFSFGRRTDEIPYTPYIFCGLSGYRVRPVVESLGETSETAAEESYTGDAVTSVAFPFGLGFRYMTKWGLNIALEWSMRKTFSDKIDGVDNQYNIGNIYTEVPQYKQLIGFQKGNSANNDWYSIAGITLTFRPGPKKNACPGIK